MSGHDEELERIRAEYARRGREIPANRYHPANAAHLFLRHGQETALRDGLAHAGLLPLEGQRALEVGCGTGRWLRLLRTFGMATEDLAGIDLDDRRLAEAAATLPGADLRCGDATRLPWDDASFDIVLQSTVFTSILDQDMQQALAREMCRVLYPGGAIVWYDFRWNNPRNPNVRGVSRKALRALFPGCRIDVRRVTLLPPLARMVAPHARLLAEVLERLRVFDSHDLAMIHPPVGHPPDADAPPSAGDRP